MESTRFLSELARQDKYLAQLPDTFEFPLFNAKHALESQRRSGYRTTAAAAREIVDNAIEAGATSIHVVFDTERDGKKKSVSGIAFIDNGSGMRPTMARYALSWGGGTHFDDAEFIGRFGFGLPNASINQTRRVEVYTRTDGSKPFVMSYLDINEVNKFGLQSVPEPSTADLPDFVQRYLDLHGVILEHGTVVVWRNPDRVQHKAPGMLKEHLLDDFGVTYRYLLKPPKYVEDLEGFSEFFIDTVGTEPVELFVETVPVEAVDPLFLYPAGRHYQREGGAQERLNKLISVKYRQDPWTGEHHLSKVEDGEIPDPTDPNLIAAGVIRVKIARFPVGFADATGSTDLAKKRWEIRKPRRGMSFVRARREIETVDVFPRRRQDIGSGMGKWPLLQTYAYYWGVEVSFPPVLDDVFGITNDKQSVRPMEDFWKILANEGIDRMLKDENRWQTEERQKAPPAPLPDFPTPAEGAAQAADTAFGRAPKVPGHQFEQVQKDLENFAEQRAEQLKQPIEDVLKAIELEAKRRRYRFEFFESEFAPFYVPKWELGQQMVIRINRQHPFYQSFYGDLARRADGGRAKDAVDVLLIALARAELTADDEQIQHWYAVQRTQVWSPYLTNAMQLLDQGNPPVEQEIEDESEQMSLVDAAMSE